MLCYQVTHTIVPLSALISPCRCSDKSFRCKKCFQSCNMSSSRIFNNDSELEIFSLVTGCFSVLAVVILAIVVIQLNSRIQKLKRQVALHTRVDLHSFHNPTIQPDEELAKRGFSMYKGQEDRGAPGMPEKDEYFGNFSAQPRHASHRY
ncbi:uncharacterized protein LOC110838945 isoform X2 [Zootermopsis nevadensis]|nr:uncharacterized protein LOC110838945 isoform X2 [Zootermopsis nevadensis]